ncbi:MAG: hypothetical protein V3T17_01945 [Pseudomonadales bacterium]
MNIEDQQKKPDAEGIRELQTLLRERLRAIKNREIPGSLRKIGREINISHTYLTEFRDGKPVSMNIMNRLANHFGYRYLIGNYSESDIERKAETEEIPGETGEQLESRNEIQTETTETGLVTNDIHSLIGGGTNISLE